jgi:hypothetical protein
MSDHMKLASDLADMIDLLNAGCSGLAPHTNVRLKTHLQAAERCLLSALAEIQRLDSQPEFQRNIGDSPRSQSVDADSPRFACLKIFSAAARYNRSFRECLWPR